MTIVGNLVNCGVMNSVVMNRVLTQRTVGVLLALWVLVFSIAGAGDLVVCLGDNGHVALEQIHQDQIHQDQIHQDQAHRDQSHSVQSCSDRTCAEPNFSCYHNIDCIDRSINSFFGRLGNQRIDKLQHSVIAHFGITKSGGADLISARIDAFLISSIKKGSLPLSSFVFTVVLC